MKHTPNRGKIAKHTLSLRTINTPYNTYINVSEQHTLEPFLITLQLL